MYRILLSLLSSLLLLSAPASAQDTQMPRIELSAGFYRIEAEVAADQRSRLQGLMGRRSLPVNQGMLFVYTQTERHCMWMKNTLVALSVAFIDAQGRILNIEDMHPQSETNHCAAAPARYALEMNQGWFAAKGLKLGSVISGLEKAPRAQ